MYLAAGENRDQLLHVQDKGHLLYAEPDEIAFHKNYFTKQCRIIIGAYMHEIAGGRSHPVLFFYQGSVPQLPEFF